MLKVISKDHLAYCWMQKKIEGTEMKHTTIQLHITRNVFIVFIPFSLSLSGFTVLFSANVNLCGVSSFPDIPLRIHLHW